MDKSSIYTLLIIQFIFGLSSVIFIMKGKLNINFAYPAFFVYFVIGLFAYKLIPNTTYGIYKLRYVDIVYGVLFTLILLIGINIGAKILKLKKPNQIDLFQYKTILIFLFYIAASFMQEFFYQPYLFDLTSSLLYPSSFLFILISGSMFSIAHLSFRNKLFWQAASIFGFLLSAFYVFVPSLLLISIIHSTVGIYAFNKGFIVLDGETRLI